MKKEQQENKKEKGLFKSIWDEIREFTVLEILFNILLYIPKLIIRFGKNFW